MAALCSSISSIPLWSIIPGKISPWLAMLRGQSQPGWWLPVVRLGCLSTADLLQLPVFNRGPFIKFAGFVTLLAELPLLYFPPGALKEGDLKCSPRRPAQGHLVRVWGGMWGQILFTSLLASPACSAFTRGDPRGDFLPRPYQTFLAAQLCWGSTTEQNQVQLHWQSTAGPEVSGCAGGVWLC